jgi:hypothetical protein
LDPIGLASKIAESAINIDIGRKGFATRGREQEGRISYETGIGEALKSFKEAQTSANPQTIILSEYAFISQEYQLCPETDTYSLKSLAHAIQGFDDAFLALQVVENSANYKEADKTHPRHSNYRVNGFPKDAFHVACISHKTRLQNILRSPGIDPIEKALLEQRVVNLSAAQSGYTVKQKKAMTA